MAKGFVKALVEQINQGVLTHADDDEDKDVSNSELCSMSVNSQNVETNGDISHSSTARKTSSSDNKSFETEAAGKQTVSAKYSPISPRQPFNTSNKSPDQSTQSPNRGPKPKVPHKKPSLISAAALNVGKNSPTQNETARKQRVSLDSSPISSRQPSNTSNKSPDQPTQSPNRGPKPIFPPKKLPLTPAAALKVGKNSSPPWPSTASFPKLPTSSPSSPSSRTAIAAPSPPATNQSTDATLATNGNDNKDDTEPCVLRHSSTPNNKTASKTGGDEVSLRDTSGRNTKGYRDYMLESTNKNWPPTDADNFSDFSGSDWDSSFDDFSDEFNEDEEENKDREKKKKSEREDITEAKEKSEQSEGQSEDKRHKIAAELLQTERVYVARLHLLHNVFYCRLDEENRQQTFLPSDDLKSMFSNTESIFRFHNDFLLPQLEDRMKNWEQDPRIGDLMKRNAPFFKLNTEYIGNFDNAMKHINQWMKKSTRFSDIIQEIQKLPECCQLSLQHHMLEPIQRVPRYELLLKDYVKHLPKDSPDMKDAKEALDLVTKAACHSNEAMKKTEAFQKLLDIYQSLRGPDVPMDFISPTREFVTQGPVTMIAARSGERQPRQIFLFNDLVLICIKHIVLGTYTVQSQLEVKGLQVTPGNNMQIPNTFFVLSNQKLVELLDENPNGESFGWKQKILDVIDRYKTQKRSSGLVSDEEMMHENAVPESRLGKTAPVMIPDYAATKCMLCEMTFTMIRRRHHCMACGKLICKSCCEKTTLEYKEWELETVCANCYDVILQDRFEEYVTLTEDDRDKDFEL